MSISAKFEPHDLWIGVYWRCGHLGSQRWIEVYICIVPMFPIILEGNWEAREAREAQ